MAGLSDTREGGGGKEEEGGRRREGGREEGRERRRKIEEGERGRNEAATGGCSLSYTTECCYLSKSMISEFSCLEATSVSPLVAIASSCLLSGNRR